MTPIIPSREERHANAVLAAEEAQFGPLKEMALGQDKILAVMGNDKWLSAGESIFKGTCAVCHGADGSGIESLGLNLTDEKYVNIDSLMGIYNIVKDGSPNNKMPPQSQFNENEIAMVSGYVAKMRGQKTKDEFNAVEDVSFSVNQGESIGLMGLNGSGKSTLLTLINGTMKPDSGQVLTRGRIAGLIATGAGFHPQLSGRDNIYLNAAVFGLTEEETKDRFDDIAG